MLRLAHDELDALHLCDGQGKTQEEAGRCMGISRGTVQRLLASARAKVTEALVHHKALAIAGTPAELADVPCSGSEWRPHGVAGENS